MNNIFSQLLSVTIPACYVILFVIAVRFLLKKAPKKFAYSLWGIVLLRLTLPIKISSVLSLIPKKATSVPTNDYFTPQVSIPDNTFVNYDAVTRTQTIITPDIVPEQTTNLKDMLINIIPYIWLAGILVLVVYSIVSCVLLYRKLKNAQFISDNIYESDKINTAFVFGIIKPKIYLPCNLSNEEKDYIIMHEQTHIKHFDHIVKIVAFAVASVYWFNPLVWIAFTLMSRDMEMSCDETVLSKLGTDVKKNYSQSLLKLATGKRALSPAPLAFSEENPKHRIKNVLSYKKPSFWVIIVCVLAIIGLCIGLLSNPKDDKIENTINEANLVNAQIIDIDTEHKTLMVIELKEDDENYFIGDRCYLNCDKNYFIGDRCSLSCSDATIYKDNQEVDFSELKIGNKIACEITEVMESYPTQADTKKIIITDERYRNVAFRFNTALDVEDTLDSVSDAAFAEFIKPFYATVNSEYGEYRRPFNSKVNSEDDKQDYILTKKELVSGDIKHFTYEYEYTHTCSFDNSEPEPMKSTTRLHIVNINGNGKQYYVMQSITTQSIPNYVDDTIEIPGLDKMNAHPGDYVYETPLMYNQKQYTLKMKMTDECYKHGVPANKDLLIGEFQFELYDRNYNLINTIPLVTSAVYPLGFEFNMSAPRIYFYDGYETIKKDNTEYPFLIFGERNGRLNSNVYGIDKNGQLKEYTFDYGDYPCGSSNNKTMPFSREFKILPDNTATDTFIDYNGNKNYITYYINPEDCTIQVVEYNRETLNDKIQPKIFCNKISFKAGEKIDIHGEVLYTGNKDEITVSIGGSKLGIASITGDNLFDKGQGSCYNPVSTDTTCTLKNDEPIKVDFTDFIWCADDDPNKEIYDEIKISKEIRLPAGNYEFKIYLEYSYNGGNHNQSISFPITVTE